MSPRGAGDRAQGILAVNIEGIQEEVTGQEEHTIWGGAGNQGFEDSGMETDDAQGSGYPFVEYRHAGTETRNAQVVGGLRSCAGTGEIKILCLVVARWDDGYRSINRRKGGGKRNGEIGGKKLHSSR